MNWWNWCLLALLGASNFAHAGVAVRQVGCAPQVAQFVEEHIEDVASWEQFLTFYGKNSSCDHPALSDAFTLKMAELAGRPDGLKSLWKETERRRWFRSFVFKRMQSETIPLDTTEAILEKLKSECPQEAKNVCRDLRVKIKKSCSACDAEK